MLTILLVVFGFVADASAQTTTTPRPLPMGEVHACAIAFDYRRPMAVQGRWGGQIAVFDATTDSQGAVVALTRRIIEGREHLPPLVRLDQFETCVRRWRFEEQAQYEVSLLGGTTYGGVWVIQVKKDDRVFRLRMPVAMNGRGENLGRVSSESGNLQLGPTRHRSRAMMSLRYAAQLDRSPDKRWRNLS